MVSGDKHFVVVGSGSAGRRHALGLRNLFPQASITLVRRFGSTQPLDTLARANVSISSSIGEACSTSPVFVAIASAATLHLSDLQELSRFCNCFLLEKPLAASADDGARIVEIVEEQGLQVTVGHHLRFSDTTRFFLDYVASRSGLRSVRLSYGQHLRHWRLGAPAESGVTARKELGGGVLRELSHEIDAAWILGSQIDDVRRAAILRVGAPTDGLVDTVADFVLGARDLKVEVHLDMTTDVPSRLWTANFDGYSVQADLLAGTVHSTEVGRATQLLFAALPGERDRAGVALLEAALTANTDSKSTSCDVRQGLRILNTIEAIEESARRGEQVPIRN